MGAWKQDTFTKPSSRRKRSLDAREGRVAVSAASRLRLLCGVERQADRVDAVPQPRRVGPVLEDVTQVRAAVRAVHLGAPHEEARVLLRRDVLRPRGLEEARPAAARLELRGRAEERGAAAGAAVDP